VAGGALTVELAASEPGRYGLRLMRGSSVEAISTPVWVEAPGAMGGSGIVSRPCAEIREREARAAAASAARRRAAEYRRAQMRRRARATRRARR
jgi:hypothetical protein